MTGLASGRRKVQIFEYETAKDSCTGGDSRERPAQQKEETPMYRVVYRVMQAFSPYPQHIYERFVEIDGLRELIDWIDDNDDVELISLKQLVEEDTPC